MTNEVQDNSMAAPEVKEKELEPSTEKANESIVHGGDETSSIGGNVPETSTVVSDGNDENTLEDAEKFMEKGAAASKEGDYGEATECYSRALEIRVAHFGELAPECLNTYYKYGCALLYKAQEEADPLGSVPKKEEGSCLASKGDASTKTNNGESSMNGVSSNIENEESSVAEECATGLEEKKEGDDVSDADDAAEEDEDESDLDLAWKMLDIARVIAEKQPGQSMEKVDILSALAETALEREDAETSLRDYLNALSILENLVEPDFRRLADLNFRICLCLELGSKPKEAIPYCEKAMSICKSRVQNLANEVKASTVAPHAEPEQSVQLSSAASDKELEIDTFSALSVELERKLEDLHQLVSNPPSILKDILAMVSGRSKEAEKGATTLTSPQVGAVEGSAKGESSSVFTASKNGAATVVTDLGKVGRSVKRVNLIPVSTELHPAKKHAVEYQDKEGNDGKDS